MNTPSDDEVARLELEHSPDAIRTRLEKGPSNSNLRDVVFGAMDGTITTFAVVAGASGAELSAGIIVIMGLANLVADGFSMGVGDFLGNRAESQRAQKTRQMVASHIRFLSQGPREAVRQIYASKGFEGEDLEKAVDVITADPERWANTIVGELHGLASVGPSALRSGLAMLLAFVAVGSIPILPFVFEVLMPGFLPNPLVWSLGLTGMAFFLVGSIKSRLLEGKWWAGGMETLAMGGLAAALAYGIGALLKGIADSI
jgi:VIT1/CCC1 family predicted Fe2+/Mn2+ transporter